MQLLSMQVLKAQKMVKSWRLFELLGSARIKGARKLVGEIDYR